MKTIYSTILLSMILGLGGCSSLKMYNRDSPDVIISKQVPSDSRFIISGQLVEKEFIKKNGEPTGSMELYLRASVQDYFIKFCESDVSREELEQFIVESETDIPPPITLEIEIIYDSHWYICEDDQHEIQSIVGDYVILKKIIDPVTQKNK